MSDNKPVDYPTLAHIMTGTVGKKWVHRDPAAAAAWLMPQPDLEDQPPGPARDAAIGGLALAAFDIDPAGADTRAAQTSGDRKCGEALQLGLAEWQGRDADASGPPEWGRPPAPGVVP